MSFWDSYYWRRYRPSRPREVEGGIKAQSKKGAFGTKWWAKRWLSVLEGFNLGARLTRGKAYARSGQVLSVDIDKGAVAAAVQGTRVRPYRVAIRVGTLSRAEWKKVAGALGRQPILAARLLAGEMPENIEEAFAGLGLSLFPSRRRDLQTNCSCPDWSNPCKHIAAVYYLLGEEFDRDPFLIFRLRGIDREELVALMTVRPTARGRKDADDVNLQRSPAAGEESEAATEHLTVDPDRFWGRAAEGGGQAAPVQIPTAAALLVRRLGNFPFWRGEESFLPALEDIYRRASPLGLRVFLGESGPGED